MNRAVVKFHALPDADGAGAQHHDLFLVSENRIIFSAVTGVEIGDVLAGMQGIHHAEHGHNAVLFPQRIHLGIPDMPQFPDLLIAKAHDLGLPQHLHIPRCRGQALFHVRDLLNALKEQAGNHGLFVHRFKGHPAPDQFRHGVQPVRMEIGDVLKQLFLGPCIKLGQVQVAYARFKAPHALEHALLQRAPDAHHLTRRLHLRSQQIAGRGELVKGEPRELGHDVVEARLHGRVAAGHRNLLQQHAHGHLGSYPGNGIAAGLAGQGGGTADPGIDLDQVVFAGIGIQRKLHVAAALDLQFTDDADGAVIEHLQVRVRQTQNRRHHHAVAGMHAHRVHIFHAADGNGPVAAVPHDLKLDFLIAPHALFHQHLVNRAQAERVGADLNELLLIVGKAAAGAAQGKGRPQHHRIADIKSGLFRLLQVIRDFAGDDRLADALAHFLEQFPVLCPFNALAGGSQELYAAFLQHTLALQLNRQIQAGLSADARNNGIRALIAQNLGNVLKCQRLHVYLVRNGGIGHDGRRVGVAQDNLIPLFLESQTGLRACVVKFCRLPDDDGAAADNKYLFYISPLCHISDSPPDIQFCRYARS